MITNILTIRVVSCFFLIFLSIIFDTGADGASSPPETVTLDTLQNLYEPVLFDHEMHMDTFDCTSCHHHTTGNGTEEPGCILCHKDSKAAEHVSCSACHSPAITHTSPPGTLSPLTYHIDRHGLKGALHLQCLDCHSSEGGPTGCRECHGFSTEGKKRFQVIDSE